MATEELAIFAGATKIPNGSLQSSLSATEPGATTVIQLVNFSATLLEI
jgi:hypothetical protein